jgi:hypothetical protein
MSRLPSAGPLIFTIPGITDAAVAPATVGPEVFFIWPVSYVISGLFLNVRSANQVDLANTRLRMMDDNRSELVSDGVGTEVRANALALVGGPLTLFNARTDRWQSFRYVVRGGERWLFQIENTGANTIVPWLGFRVETDTPVHHA